VAIRKKEKDKSHFIKTIDDHKNLTAKGKYMEVMLKNIYVDIPLKSNRTNTIRSFTIVEVLFHNIWDYRISINPSLFKLIDTEGFQHNGNGCSYYEYDHAVMSPDKYTPVSFAWPELTLEDHTKTIGHIWFKALTRGLPHRLIFVFQIFEPGDISGWQQDRETIEFIIPDLQTSHPLLSYYNPA